MAPSVEPWGVVSIVPLGYQAGVSFMGKKTSSFGKAWNGPALNLGAQTELQPPLSSAGSVKIAEGDQGAEAFHEAQLGS